MEIEKKANNEEVLPKPIEETEDLGFLNSIKEVLSLNNQNLIDNKIFENTINIKNFLKDIDNKLYEEFNLSSKEVNTLIRCLKFIDTLNLFMTQPDIFNIGKLMNRIYETINCINTISKDSILYQITYTEKSLIYYKKAFFKNLFFDTNQKIFETFDDILNENNIYDVRTFKQIQNLFYIFSMKIDEKSKEILLKKINYLKSIILPHKKIPYENNQFNNEKYKKYNDENYGYSNKKYNDTYYNEYEYNNKNYLYINNNINNNYENYNSQQYNKPYNNSFMNKNFNNVNYNLHNSQNKNNMSNEYKHSNSEYGYNNLGSNAPYVNNQSRYSNNVHNQYQYNAFNENDNTPVKNINNKAGYYGVNKTNSINNEKKDVKNEEVQPDKNINTNNNLLNTPSNSNTPNLKELNIEIQKETVGANNNLQTSSSTETPLPLQESNSSEAFGKTSEKVELIKLDINQMFDIIPKSQPSQCKTLELLFAKDDKVGNLQTENDDENYSIESSKSGNEDFEGLEDMEEDDFSDDNEDDEFTNYIKQDLEDKLNSDLYADKDTETKNDKIIFGTETGKPDVNTVSDSEYKDMRSNTENIVSSDSTPSIKNFNQAVIEKINIQKSTPYIPLSQTQLNQINQSNQINQTSQSNEITNTQQMNENYNANQVLFRGKDSTIHKEYFSIKLQEQANPEFFKANFDLFETYILTPLYQKINIGVYKKKMKYYQCFTNYKKIIHRTLNKSKMLKKVKPYGSYVNNFLTESGDIDICIVPKCKIIDFRDNFKKLKEVIIEKNIADVKLFQISERYGLLKIIDRETQIVIDITVHTMLPILNSKLVKTYSVIDQRFHIMGIYLKHWAKINKIHGAADNFLSSYALLIMLIHFLQNVLEVKVLPNLQRVDRKEKMYSYVQNGSRIQTNIFFEENEVKIKKELDRINNGKVNEESVVALLIKFFEYYSYYFDSQTMKISISDSELVLKTDTDNYPFSIVDPFDPTHNPGKSVTYNTMQFNKLVTSMKKEINFIYSGEYIKRIESINK